MQFYGIRAAAGALGAGAVAGAYFSEAAQNTTYSDLTSLASRVGGIEKELGIPTMKCTEGITYHKPMVMAEIGCNHMGSMDIAKELLDIAKESGADYAKFQKRNNIELLSEEQYNAPHPVPANSYGDTYGAHREFLEFDVDQHRELMEYCNSIGLGYSTSVWDTTSAKEIVTLKPDLIKVGSPSNQHFEMMKVLRDEYEGDLHVSTGMTTKEEIEKIVKFFEETGCAKDRLVLYNCTSGYPVPFKDVCLLEVSTMREKYGNRVKHIGFSGHHHGTWIDIAAYTLGATWNERHFTKDRSWKGTDHGASLTPGMLTDLCTGLSNCHEALGFKSTDVLPIEMVQRKKLKFGQYNKAAVEQAAADGLLAGSKKIHCEDTGKKIRTTSE